MDGDMVEDLLKESDLTLEATISKCRAQEAAKQQRAEITNTPLGHTAIQTVRKPLPTAQQHPPTGTWPGCGSPHHKGGRQRCPAFNVTCRSCNKLGHFARVCRSRRKQQASLTTHPQAPTTNIVHAGPPVYPQAYLTSTQQIEPAPTITAHMSALNGEAVVMALPDSGADISMQDPPYSSS